MAYNIIVEGFRDVGYPMLTGTYPFPAPRDCIRPTGYNWQDIP